MSFGVCMALAGTAGAQDVGQPAAPVAAGASSAAASAPTPLPLTPSRSLGTRIGEDARGLPIIVRADSLAPCEAQVAPLGLPGTPPAPQGVCVIEDGVELLTYGPSTADQVTYQSVSAWVHGYMVTVGSYNAADGKDVPPVTAVPPITMAELTTLVTSDAWFEPL